MVGDVLRNLYKKIIMIIVYAIIIVSATKVWVVICHKGAILLHTKRQIKQHIMYVISYEIESPTLLNALDRQIKLSSMQEVSIIHLSPAECVLNKCEADLIFSAYPDFIDQNLVRYTPSSPSSLVENTVNELGGANIDGLNIISTIMLQQPVQMYIPTSSRYDKTLSQAIVSVIQSKEVQNMPLEEATVRDYKQEMLKKNAKKAREESLTRKLAETPLT